MEQSFTEKKSVAQLPAGHFIVSPDVLISYICQICEIALDIPLFTTSNDGRKESPMTSSVATVKIDDNQSYLLFLRCDDSLLNTAFKKTLSLTKNADIHALNILSSLTNTISNELTSLFNNDPSFGFPAPPKHSRNGVIAESVLEHESGCIHVILTTLG